MPGHVDLKNFKKSVSLDENTCSKSKSKVNLRIAIMGASNVGKTAIISRLVNGSFPEKHKATVEELHHVDFSGTGSLSLDILDTSGSFEFPAMRRLAIVQSQAFALVYSCDDKETFEEVRRIRDEILEERSKPENGSALPVPPILIVANKSDAPEESKKVKSPVAETIVCVDWENKFIECSAKTGHNIPQLFEMMLRVVHENFSQPNGHTLRSLCRQWSLPGAVNANGMKVKKKDRHSCNVS